MSLFLAKLIGAGTRGGWIQAQRMAFPHFVLLSSALVVSSRVFSLNCGRDDHHSSSSAATAGGAQLSQKFQKI